MSTFTLTDPFDFKAITNIFYTGRVQLRIFLVVSGRRMRQHDFRNECMNGHHSQAVPLPKSAHSGRRVISRRAYDAT